MTTGMSHQRDAVKSGYLTLYHYDPRLGMGGADQPLKLDSRKPTLPLEQFTMKEGRFAMLAQADPARELMADERRGAVQTRQHGVGIAMAGQHAHEHLRHRQVGIHLDVGHAHHAGHAGIAQLVLEQVRDLLAHGVRHPFGTDPHARCSSQSSTSAPCTL